jgi:hypothetical protein
MKGKQTQQNPKIDKVGIDTLTGGPCPIASAIPRSLSSYAPTGAPRCTERKRAARRPTGASFYAC